MRVQPQGQFYPESTVITGVGQPLGEVDLSYVADAVVGFLPDWSVELHRAFNGEATLVLMPDDADDLVGPTFVVRREGGSFSLEQFHWDIYSTVGTFATLREVVYAVRLSVADFSGAMTPGSMLRH